MEEQQAAAEPLREPTPKWKENVRKRHSARYELGDTCDRCGAKANAVGGLGRHHEWTEGRPGSPPPIIASLCRRCHMIVEGRLMEFTCPDCGETVTGKRRHLPACHARRMRLWRKHYEWRASKQWLPVRVTYRLLAGLVMRVAPGFRRPFDEMWHGKPRNGRYSVSPTGETSVEPQDEVRP